jgi:hypothetical protein
MSCGLRHRPRFHPGAFRFPSFAARLLGGTLSFALIFLGLAIAIFDPFSKPIALAAGQDTTEYRVRALASKIAVRARIVRGPSAAMQMVIEVARETLEERATGDRDPNPAISKSPTRSGATHRPFDGIKVIQARNARNVTDLDAMLGLLRRTG